MPEKNRQKNFFFPIELIHVLDLGFAYRVTYPFVEESNVFVLRYIRLILFAF